MDHWNFDYFGCLHERSLEDSPWRRFFERDIGDAAESYEDDDKSEDKNEERIDC